MRAAGWGLRAAGCGLRAGLNQSFNHLISFLFLYKIFALCGTKFVSILRPFVWRLNVFIERHIWFLVMDNNSFDCMSLTYAHVLNFYPDFKICWKTFQPPDDKTNRMACAPSEDSDEPGHGHGDAKADQSLRWVHRHFVGFVMRRLICSLGFPLVSCYAWCRSWLLFSFLVQWRLGWALPFYLFHLLTGVLCHLPYLCFQCLYSLESPIHVANRSFWTIVPQPVIPQPHILTGVLLDFDIKSVTLHILFWAFYLRMQLISVLWFLWTWCVPQKLISCPVQLEVSILIFFCFVFALLLQ